MGQYYEVMAVKEGNLIHLDRSVKGGGYMGAKLMEHSWCGNSFCDAVTNMLMDSPARVIWMGDYADDDRRMTDGYIQAFIESMNEGTLNQIKESTNQSDPYLALYKYMMDDEGTSLPAAEVDYDVLYLVNNTKQEYIVMEEYMKVTADSDGWNTYPLSILTSLGNGQGGGDYYGLNSEMAGYWAGDEVYFSKTKPEGYNQCDLEDYRFIEE